MMTGVLDKVRKEIDNLYRRFRCNSCHRTLFFSDGKNIYIKCPRCKNIEVINIDKLINKDYT